MNRRIIIEGEGVHHVGYRPFLFVRAREFGIPNYHAKNIIEEGIQKVIVSIGGEENQLKKFIEFAKKNHPPEAKVSGVKEAEPPEYVMSIDEYDKILAAEQQSTVVQTGLKMLKKQDQTIKSIDRGFAKTDQEFQTLRQDYGKISQTMEKILESMDNTSKKTERVLEILTQQQEGFTQAINGLTKAILKLAEKR